MRPCLCCLLRGARDFNGTWRIGSGEGRQDSGQSTFSSPGPTYNGSLGRLYRPLPDTVMIELSWQIWTHLVCTSLHRLRLIVPILMQACDSMSFSTSTTCQVLGTHADIHLIFSIPYVSIQAKYTLVSIDQAELMRAFHRGDC